MKKNERNIPSIFPKEFPREDILKAINIIEILQDKLNGASSNFTKKENK